MIMATGLLLNRRLMNRTMSVHVRDNSWCMSLSTSNDQILHWLENVNHNDFLSRIYGCVLDAVSK